MHQVPWNWTAAHRAGRVLVIDETAYLRKHMTEALQQLEAAGRLQVAENKSDGKKRRAKTFPNEALATFR